MAMPEKYIPREFHLRSSKFPIQPREEEEITNPGTYGQALAEYMQKSLQARDYSVPFICCEDFGWWVEVKLERTSVGVTCIRAHEDDGPCDFAVVAGDCEMKWSWKHFGRVNISSELEALEKDLLDVFTKDTDIEVIARNFDSLELLAFSDTSEDAPPGQPPNDHAEKPFKPLGCAFKLTAGSLFVTFFIGLTVYLVSQIPFFHEHGYLLVATALFALVVGVELATVVLSPDSTTPFGILGVKPGKESVKRLKDKSNLSSETFQIVSAICVEDDISNAGMTYFCELKDGQYLHLSGQYLVDYASS